MRMDAGLLAYEGEVKPGWIAFFLVMLLIAATFLLWRSMNTQLRKIRVPPRASYDKASSDDAPSEDGGPKAPSSGPAEPTDRADDPPPSS